MIHLEKFRTIAEVNHCAELYLGMNDESFIPSSHMVSCNSLAVDIKNNCPARIIFNDDEIVGFILAGFTKLQFSAMNMLVTKFYVSNLKGYASAKAVWMSHQYLIDVAEGSHIPIVMTQCSPFDSDMLLCKILQKKGWDIRGHTAIYKTKYFK